MVIRESKKPWIITIIVLTVIILGLGGYIAYDYFILSKDEEKIVTVIDDVNINLNAFYQISDTLEKFDKAYNTPGTNYYGYIYGSKKLEAKKMDPKAALYAALASEMIPSNVRQTIPGDRVKNNLKRMFGDIIKYNPEEVNIDGTLKIGYDKVNNIHAYTIPVKNTNYSNGYVTANIKTYLKDDYVIITRKTFYVEYSDPNSPINATVYTSSSKRGRLGTVSVKNGQVNTKEVLSKYSTKLNTYDFYFIKNSDEDYTFYKVIKTR